MKNKNIELLLSINEAIATIYNNRMLFDVIFEKLQMIFKFKMAGILMLDEEKTNYELSMSGYYLPGEESSIDQLFHEKMPIEESPFEFLTNKPEIKVVTVESTMNAMEILPTDKILALLNKYEITHFLFLPLNIEGELIGTLIFLFSGYPELNKENKELLNDILKPIAIAVSNSHMYEEMERQKLEKTMRLELVSAFIPIKNREKLFHVMANEISKQKDVFYIGLNVKDADLNDSITICFIKDDKFGVKKIPIDNNRDLPILTLKSRLIESEHKNYVEYVWKEFQLLMEKSAHFKYLHEHYEISSALYTRYVSAGDEVNLIVGQKNKSGFLGWEIESIVSLLPQMAVILKNLFAFEQIDLLRKRLEEEKHYLIDEIKLSGEFHEMIGNSLEMQSVQNKIKQVAALDVTVLIDGETGTGKELIAYAIHNLSLRSGGPFIKLNCAALPPQLIESELFGHERGSFTGAIEKRIGKFELANGGTIFLDEIGELPLELQAKFLRVLQEKEFERIGGQATHKTNVRVVAATNRNLQKEVEKGLFRKDLFFRLNVFPITAPPLNKRLDDIPLLLKYFVEKYSKKIGKPIMSIKKNELEALMQYNWPGNVRELENVIERAVIISNGPDLVLEDILRNKTEIKKDESINLKTLVEVEKEHIIAALKAANGQITGEKGAAKILGLNGKTLGTKMRKLGIKRTVSITG
jgi:formate hydrogenlyase transcriptional activator